MKFGIRYLTGYSASYDSATQQAEWPPHPARVFMAMAAAYFETGAIPHEKFALEWLESQPAPKIYASDVDLRSRYDVFVTVNDSAGGILDRSRQPRQFPKCRPSHDTVYLDWGSTAPPEVVSGMESLCGKVTRIGHSSSLVNMWIEHEFPNMLPSAWLPVDSQQDHWLRVPESGFLGYLERQFNGKTLSDYFALRDNLESAKGREKQRLRTDMAAKFPGGQPISARPVTNSWHGYRMPGRRQLSPQTVSQGPFDSTIIVLSKVEGPMLGLASTLQLTGALRNAVMKHGPQPPPEWVSGHSDDAKPSRSPHLAFFPMPFVGAEYADGHVMGLGIAVPRSLIGVPSDGRNAALRDHIGSLLFDAEHGEPATMELARKDSWRWILRFDPAVSQSSVTLNPSTWTRPSRTWASVTPVVLHHYPKRGRDDVERILREAFVSAGLPEPESLHVRSVSQFQGAGHIKDVPPYTEGGANFCRYQTHVKVRFAHPIAGPLLVGRGRFRGYGLLRPLLEGRIP